MISILHPGNTITIDDMPDEYIILSHNLISNNFVGLTIENDLGLRFFIKRRISQIRRSDNKND